MLDSMRWQRRPGRRSFHNGDDVTDATVSDRLSRARHLWRCIVARERMNP
jgi:hypothetical protein